MRLPCVSSLQVNKAQNAQKGLNPSRFKDAKGTALMLTWMVDAELLAFLC